LNKEKEARHGVARSGKANERGAVLGGGKNALLRKRWRPVQGRKGEALGGDGGDVDNAEVDQGQKMGGECLSVRHRGA